MKKTLSNKETKEISGELASYQIILSKKDKLEVEDGILLINNVPVCFLHEGKPIPTLKTQIKSAVLKKVEVDMGAIRFVTSGADVMRPGIVKIDEGISNGEPIAVVDMTHKKPLAIGIALFSSEEMQGMSTGKVIHNLHYIGDRIWNYIG
ncbi:MAG: DUF1947 domain-containing protein [Nanoarchaeota archaeon]|nr:DUF1947 domain-containing protein [Nanoarchaeota archaeon]